MRGLRSDYYEERVDDATPSIRGIASKYRTDDSSARRLLPNVEPSGPLNDSVQRRSTGVHRSHIYFEISSEERTSVGIVGGSCVLSSAYLRLSNRRLQDD